MKRGTTLRWACLAGLLACAGICPAEAVGIAERKIAAVQEELTEAGEKRGSATSKRRAYKNIVRDAEELIEDAPEAPNRFPVLAIMLESQMHLLGIESSERNRAALLDTCKKLAEAPDAYAELRLQADLLLSENALAQRNADVKERAEALSEMILRYRDTPGEAKSLMMASQIAPKLEAFDLEIEILRQMQNRFSDHHEVIEFRRKSLAAGRIEALFRGAFTRTDGTVLNFPVDRLGHPCIMVFWSKDTSGIDVALKLIDEHKALHPERFEFYSFNLDELPDGGASVLKDHGLDWSVMRLPGGRSSQTFRTYGQREPVSILVNAYGYTLLTPTHNYGRGHGGAVNPYQVENTRITSERYLAQLQSLFIGDFLVVEPDEQPSTAESIPAERLKAIQACFVRAPMRYRLTREEARANYEQAAKLCGEVLAEFPNAPESSLVRDRRIIALIGLWKLAAEPKHLEQAVEEAEVALSGSPSPREQLVSRFCLAKQALRASSATAKQMLSDLVAAADGSEPALATAAILALDANSIELHQQYRAMALNGDPSDPILWPVTTFLEDRYHRFDLLKVKLSRPERRIRGQYGEFVSPRQQAINHTLDPMTNGLPRIALQTLDGETLTLPDDTKDQLTLLMFVEPPAEPDAVFPLEIGGLTEGKRHREGVMQYAFEREELHIRNEVQVIAAFLSDDTERVKALMEKHAWPCRAALVPDGLENPLVRQLGICSADRIPNVFLLRRDGTVAWHTSGFVYKSDFGYPFAIKLAMKLHIEVCDTERAFEALADGNYPKAKDYFSGPFLPEKDERFDWNIPRLHGRALANLGLNDAESALADIDAAIEAHPKGFNHEASKPCASMLKLQRLRAAILAKLGKSVEAEAARSAVGIAPTEYPLTIYDAFHDKLEGLNIELRK